jgi:hypothetical protein
VGKVVSMAPHDVAERKIRYHTGRAEDALATVLESLKRIGTIDENWLQEWRGDIQIIRQQLAQIGEMLGE